MSAASDGTSSGTQATPSTRPLGGVVVRRRLVELVETLHDGRIVAISAPAGWGKSELLSSWERSRQSSTRSAWVLLEPGDDTPRRFWRRFLEAVSTSGWSRNGVLSSLQVAPDGEVEVGEIVRTIVDRVPLDAEPLVIVIDDLHVLHGESADGLARLVKLLPPPWRLVLSGRSLPVPLTRLRVAGIITSIGTAELAFDTSETAALFVEAGCRLTGPEVADLVNCTEGWAAGLRLASMPLAQGARVADVLSGVRAGQHDIERYFREEVLAAVPRDVADFLLDTSVTPTLDASLAQHLSGRVDAASLLHSLNESGVFTAADRAHAGLYRYHPLLAGSLEQYLHVTDPLRRARLHRAAAEWFQQRGRASAAFSHAVTSEAWALCLELLDELWIPMFVGGDYDGLVALLGVLPRSIVRQDRTLLALGDLLALDRANGMDADRVADPGDSATPAELVLAMEVARRAGRVDLARGAASTIMSRAQAGDGGVAPLRAYVLLSLGVVEYWAGDRVAAERDLREALAESVRDGLDYLRLGCLSQLVGVLTAQNRVNDAEQLADAAAQLAVERGWEGSGWASELWHALGWIHYLRAELDVAAGYLERAETSVWHHDAVIGTIIPTIAALVERLRRRPAQAKALLDLADSRLPVARDQYVFLAYIDAEQARHAIEHGELRRAREYLSDGQAARSLHHCVAMAELRIAENRRDDARRALRRGLDDADGWLDQRLHVMALLASLESPEDARELLLGAMRMGSTERIIQPFCQVGAPIMGMIGDIARSHRGLRPFANEIRERFAQLDAAPARGGTGPEELTTRELEVLQLLEGHDSLADIAARLHVSVNTLKVHTRHVYDKLGVRSRREALAAAAVRGLL